MKLSNPRRSTGANLERIAWRHEWDAVSIRLHHQMDKVFDYFNNHGLDGANSCAYCGFTSQNLTWDHLVPITKGGHTVFGNMVRACKSCNSSKREKQFEEWMEMRTGKSPSARKNNIRATKRRLENLREYQKELERNIEYQEIKQKIFLKSEEIDRRRRKIESLRITLKSELEELAELTNTITRTVTDKR